MYPRSSQYSPSNPCGVPHWSHQVPCRVCPCVGPDRQSHCKGHLLCALVCSFGQDILRKNFDQHRLKVDHVCGAQGGGKAEDARTGEALVADPEHEAHTNVLLIGVSAFN